MTALKIAPETIRELLGFVQVHGCVRSIGLAIVQILWIYIFPRPKSYITQKTPALFLKPKKGVVTSLSYLRQELRR